MQQNQQYGEYPVPPTIEKLYALEQELGEDMDRKIGLIMLKEDFRYSITPPDLIPFACCGVDGIHYGFLTDAGTVKDLEQAFIAVVSPMNFGAEVWIVASNIKDFLRVVYTDSSILYNHFATIEAYEKYVVKKAKAGTIQDQDEVMKKLKETFQLAKIDNMSDYLSNIGYSR